MSQIRQSSPVARRLFATAYASKKAALDKGDISKARMGSLWDKLVFSKLKAKLGGEVALMTTGAVHTKPLVFTIHGHHLSGRLRLKLTQWLLVTRALVDD